MNRIARGVFGIGNAHTHKLKRRCDHAHPRLHAMHGAGRLLIGIHARKHGGNDEQHNKKCGAANRLR